MSPRSWLPVLLLLLLALAPSASAQAIASRETVVIARGQSALLPQATPVQRVSIGDPRIADAVVISPREVLVNAIELGTTTLILWDQAGGRRVYSIEVTVDAAAMQRTIAQLYPGEPIRVLASGKMVILSGAVSNTRVARQAIALAQNSGAEVVDNLTAPPAQQVMLQVRVAEINRSAIKEFRSRFIGRNVGDLKADDTWSFETFSDGVARILLSSPTASIEAFFDALRTTGEVRMLAEPNLIAMDGTEASFLAGGEFPFPVVQGVTGAVSIQWREFGVRLKFVPGITGGGNIRLAVNPEVSTLDFASGLVVSGFAVPAILTRRALTEVELRDGQTFAIAGLLDHNTLRSTTRIPLLGDLPVLGPLFRSIRRREDSKELLVLVTPHLVSPQDVAPPVPTGEPSEWKWDPWVRPPPRTAAPPVGDR